MDRLDGILPVYKDAGMTSHDVIYCLRRIMGRQKIGHTGTLDPMASGLLLICMGRATKLTQFLTDWDKSYEGELTLGKTSDTLDGDGIVTQSGTEPNVSIEDIEKILKKYTGTFEQQVPAYSAVKVNGKELYKYARKGQDVAAPVRKVEIAAIDLVSYEKPRLTIRVDCGKGTYIRTLADDIGRDLGCGAYLSRLKRTRVGSHTIDDALTLEQVTKARELGNLAEWVLPMQSIIGFPMIMLRNSARPLVQNGGVPDTGDIINCQGDFIEGDLIGMADEAGELLAIGKSKCHVSALATESGRDYFSYVRVLI